MKTFFIAMGLVFAAAAFANPASAQTSGTTLQMRAMWDDGSPVQGTVTLGLVHVLGADTLVTTATLSNGRTSVNEALSATSLYNITVVTPSGSTLLKFPITTALINPQNLKEADIRLVLRKADNSLKYAHIEVSMGF
jgi:hypothetical protein